MFYLPCEIMKLMWCEKAAPIYYSALSSTLYASTPATTPVAPAPSSTATKPVTGVPPPTPGFPNAAANCNSWYQVTSADTCNSVVAKISSNRTVALADIHIWNPSLVMLPNDCVLWLGYYYCIGTYISSILISVPGKKIY